jgi:yokI1
MDGTKSDFSKIYEQLSEDLNLPNKTAAQAWLSENKLTPHHLDSETIQLIPTDLHGNIPHIGSASDMRNLLNK